MAKKENQKLKLLYLAKIFQELTDEEHGLTMPEIISLLEEYGVSADRKTIYLDLEELRHFGYDISAENAGRQTFYKLLSRSFELAELKLLVDSVLSAKFITENKSRALIKKLEGLVSVYEARQLHRQVLISGRVKTMNESVYYNIDKLHTAINTDCKIKFRYFRWNTDKQEEYRRDGAWYCISPWHLRWDDENYYLIGYDPESGKLKHYRVDKMKNISLAGSPREGQEQMRDFDATLYTKRLFGMYGGEAVRVTLECEKHMVGVLIDRFGKDIPIIKLPDGRIQSCVEVAVSPQFLGWAASLSEDIRVTAPPKVVAGMHKLSQRLLEQYGTGGE